MRKGKSGYYSTAADVELGPPSVIDLILEHRQLAKLKGTYIDALPLLVNRHRASASYNETGATTLVESAAASQTQNIPIRTDVSGCNTTRVARPGGSCLFGRRLFAG